MTIIECQEAHINMQNNKSLFRYTGYCVNQICFYGQDFIDLLKINIHYILHYKTQHPQNNLLLIFSIRINSISRKSHYRSSSKYFRKILVSILL